MSDNELDEFGTELEDDGQTVPSNRKVRGGEPIADDAGEEKSKTKNFDYVQWTNAGDGVYTYTGQTQATLKSGAYSYFKNQGRLFLQKQELKTDELLEFQDSLSSDLIHEIETFWDSKEVFHKFGFLHKRGYILYGQAGCGKTGILQLVIQKVIAREGLVILVDDPGNLAQITTIIRAIEPTRHLVVIVEDIDAVIRNCGEGGLLSFLDGENQVDDILTIATTNYPERLDKRIISRPRRFDKRIRVLPPEDNTSLKN